MKSRPSHLLLAAVFVFSTNFCALAEKEIRKALVADYATLVHANYQDALKAAREHSAALKAFTEAPSPETLQTAKRAWMAARIPYLQTEVFRFYGGPIDGEDGPEGLINAWPMDEAYVDYVAGAPKSGIINDPENFPAITGELIVELNEREGEENVSTGFHAVEFLLWGQDRDANGPGARPHTDYTTAVNADRRRAFLIAAGDLLVSHLELLVDEWAPEKDNYRKRFETAPTDYAIRRILTGMSMLSGFEFSGERLLVALETRSQEDEHSCFSDTTHLDARYDALGIRNVWTGDYVRTDGTLLSGTGVVDLAEAVDEDLATRLGGKIQASCALATALPAPFDQAILGNDDAKGRAAIMTLVESLEDQADLLVELSEKLGVGAVPVSED